MKESTKFAAGVSGNPKGRKKGTTVAHLLRKSIADDMPEIILKLVEQAKNGDTAAAKILLDRCCPVLKPQAMAIHLPVNGSLAEQGGEIIRATMTGQIPPDIGSQLITALSNQGKLVELQELTERLDRIEKKLTHEQSLEYLK
jgi:dihydrodipicolinate synthase/N-acetylneuraminate lyase